MKLKIAKNRLNIGTKAIGVVLIIIGLVFLYNPTSLNLKLGFASILIGILIVFMITKRSSTENITNIQVKGNTEVIKKIINELNLKGNAIFIPKSEYLTEERILIPPSNNPTSQVPNISNDNFFLKNHRNKNLGLVVPPLGLKLLNNIEDKEKIVITKIEDVEKKLQTFVGLDLVKSVSFKQVQDAWELELEKPIFCPKDLNLCKQYPCPACSAILIVIMRAMVNPELRIRVKDAAFDGDKVKFYINFVKRKTEIKV